MKLKLALGALAAGLMAMAPANAAVTVYDNSGDFLANAGGILATEDFNSYGADVSFSGTTIDIGDFTVTHNGSTSTPYNVIDAHPLGIGDFDIDGTSLLNGGVVDGETIVLTFDAPIYAFAADFSALNDGVQRSFFQVAGEDIYLPVLGGVEQQFVGFISDIAFTTITLVSLAASEGYGMDNLMYGGASEVPIPAALPLLLSGLGAMGFASRRKKKAA